MAKKKRFKMESRVWLWPGENASWHFVSIDKKQSAEIKELYGKQVRGFRSIPVMVKMGKSEWKTSIFPDSKSGMYLLPLKAKVRQAEGVFVGDVVKYSIEILL